MESAPKHSQYSLVPGRQSYCILDIQTSPLQRQGVYFNDGAYTRLAWSVLPNTRDALGKHKRDLINLLTYNYIKFGQKGQHLFL